MKSRIRQAYLRFANASQDIYEWLGGDDFVRLHHVKYISHIGGDTLWFRMPYVNHVNFDWIVEIQKIGLDSYKLKVFRYKIDEDYKRLHHRMKGISANRLYAEVVRITGHPYLKVIRDKIE